MRTVVPVPRRGHLPLRAARLFLLCVSLEVFSTPTRRNHGRMLIHPSLPACATPNDYKGARTHAGSGPSRVRRRLFLACLIPLATKSHLSLHRHPQTSLEMVEETLLILQESQCDFLLELVDAVPRWMFSGPDLLQGVLIRPSSIGKINSPCLGNITSFALSLL